MKSFESLGLSRGLVESVQQLGFEVPTPIQEKAIPVLLKGSQDFVGLAQTGTGKTAAFGLPLLDRVDDRSKETQALVLAPTRELGLQIASDLENFSEKFKSFNIVAVYGGASISEQIRKVKARCADYRRYTRTSHRYDRSQSHQSEHNQIRCSG